MARFGRSVFGDLMSFGLEVGLASCEVRRWFSFTTSSLKEKAAGSGKKLLQNGVEVPDSEPVYWGLERMCVTGSVLGKVAPKYSLRRFKMSLGEKYFFWVRPPELRAASGLAVSSLLLLGFPTKSEAVLRSPLLVHCREEV